MTSGRICPNCLKKLESLKKPITELFSEKDIFLRNRTIRATTTREKKRRDQFGNDFQIAEGHKRINVKKAEYSYYCHSCNTVFPSYCVFEMEEIPF